MVAAVDSFPARAAVRVLARDGVEAIWNLHDAAATAHRDGHQGAAEALIEIADAAEQIWWQRVVKEFGSPWRRSTAPDK
jgi:hypothetical protein